MLVPGTVVEPKDIKLFKTRLRDRNIIIVNEADFDKWNEYFKNKFGTGIKVPEQNDAGQNDAGQNDAGQNDAGQNDAGQNDAGQNDAGQNEPPVKPQAPKVVVKLG
jgi:hypothetical protein